MRSLYQHWGCASSCYRHGYPQKLRVRAGQVCWYFFPFNRANQQRRSEGFWRPGRRLPFGAPLPGAPPPHPSPPQKKIVIHQNLRNHLNYSKNLAIKKQIKFLVGRFLVVGDHLDSTFPYFWKIVSVFCQCGGAKTSINSDFFFETD